MRKNQGLEKNNRARLMTRNLSYPDLRDHVQNGLPVRPNGSHLKLKWSGAVSGTEYKVAIGTEMLREDLTKLVGQR
jgi:hypothetical protein